MPTRFTLIALVAVSCAPAARAGWETVTPATPTQTPVLVLLDGEVRQSALVPAGGFVRDQFAGAGVVFGPLPVAIGESAFRPVGSRFVPVEAQVPTELNFSRGFNAVIGVRFVETTGLPRVVSGFEVEVVGATAGDVAVSYTNGAGTFQNAIGAVGTANGRAVFRSGPIDGGVTEFDVYRLLSLTEPFSEPWGVSAISYEVPDAPGTVGTPEPATLVLALSGAVVCLRRRR
jgi:hypothetical protein